MKKMNLIGQRFTRLLVIGEEPSDARGNSRWLCECNCGNHVIVTGVQLRHGVTKSCGCLRRDLMKERSRTNPVFRRYTGDVSNFSDEHGILYSSLKKSVRNKTGHLGVSYDKHSDTWFARLMRHNRYVLLKSFPTMEEAIAAREEAERTYLGRTTAQSSHESDNRKTD